MYRTTAGPGDHAFVESGTATAIGGAVCPAGSASHLYPAEAKGGTALWPYQAELESGRFSVAGSGGGEGGGLALL